MVQINSRLDMMYQVAIITNFPIQMRLVCSRILQNYAKIFLNYNNNGLIFDNTEYLLLEGDMIVYDETESDDFDDNEYHDAINDTDSLWTLNSTTGTVEIPYMIDSNINDDFRREKIEKAVDEFHYKTCIR